MQEKPRDRTHARVEPHRIYGRGHECLERMTHAEARPLTASAAVVVHFDVSISPAAEQRMIEVLTDEAKAGENIDAIYKRKESELGALFAALSPLESRALRRRLSTVEVDDVLATLFGRMIEPRRHRLLSFLSDAARRDAIARGRR